MRVLYYTTNHEIDSVVTAALSALGHDVVMRSVRQFGTAGTRCDLLVVKGYRKQQRKIVRAYGKPSLVLDWGYFARVNERDEAMQGHWQISQGALNALPHGDYPDDRLIGTGIELLERAPSDGYVLVCGQMPNDAAVYGTDHAQWLRDVIHGYRARGLDVRYREHPRGGVKISGVPTADGPLDKALAGARLVVCYNSNVAHEALIAGIPVVCDPCAPYAELSGETIPSMAARRAYFSRAAYGQWLASEFAEGFQHAIEVCHERHRIPAPPALAG